MDARELQELINRFKRKGALVDSNLLVLYFLARYDPKQIPRTLSTKAFEEKDGQLLSVVLGHFDRIYTTPHILTEVSNLSKLPASLLKEYRREFRTQVDVLEERTATSRTICNNNFFERLGLADAGIMQVVDKELLVITDDLQLSVDLGRIGVNCINYNHIRFLS